MVGVQNDALARKCDDLQSGLAAKQAEAATAMAAHADVQEQLAQLRQVHIALQVRVRRRLLSGSERMDLSKM